MVYSSSYFVFDVCTKVAMYVNFHVFKKSVFFIETLRVKDICRYRFI